MPTTTATISTATTTTVGGSAGCGVNRLSVYADPTATTALRRAARPGYHQWLRHVRAAGGCTHPVRLVGDVHSVDPATGELLGSRSTLGMPDGVIYTPCGNRREAVCPWCSQIYRADTYQLVRAGMVGGKGVPASVASHPAAFVTVTAPSFGAVHSTRAKDGRSRTCRPRRRAKVCPHDIDLRCDQIHADGDPVLGQPLCLDCYCHEQQVVWNLMSAELWRRTTTTLAKRLKKLGARASFAKVAEMQTRGVVHFHALIRLDGLDPDVLFDADGRLVEQPSAPPAGVTLTTLVGLLEAAVSQTSFDTPPHREHPAGWRIAWGEQLDIRAVHGGLPGEVTDTKVAAYLAKYATKATESTGHTSSRLHGGTVGDYADTGTHVGRLIEACWRLGAPGSDVDPIAAVKNAGRLSYTRLRRWAHMLGFGGHFATKSRAYSTTLRALRAARTAWRRQTDEAEAEATLLVGHLAYTGAGWHTTGDALLATTAAVQAREHVRVAREEISTSYDAPAARVAA